MGYTKQDLRERVHQYKGLTDKHNKRGLQVFLPLALGQTGLHVHGARGLVEVLALQPPECDVL